MTASYTRNFWINAGIDETTLEAAIPMTATSMAKMLDASRPTYDLATHRLIPSSFNVEDPTIRPLPLSTEYSWRSLRAFLNVAGARALLYRIPLVWQAHFAAHDACRAAGIPYLANDPDNIPVGAAAVHSAGTNAIITEASRAYEFWSFCEAQRSAQPTAWFLVHETQSKQWDVPLSVQKGASVVFQEVHVFPGVPLLEQCDSLASEKQPRFHRVEFFEWVDKQESAFITAKVPQTVPVIEYALPFRLRNDGICDCGRNICTRV